MPLVSQTIPSFKGGVSQQPDILKYPDQLIAQLNCLSDPIAGLLKRPPTMYVNRLYDTIDNNVFTHFIERDDREKYLVSIFPSTGDIKVHSAIDGTPRVVKMGAEAKGYLTAVGSRGRDTYGAITVADYTIITNRRIIARMDTTKRSPVRNPEALIVVKGGEYGKKYEIFIGGVLATQYTLPDGSKPEHSLEATSQSIINKLSEGLRTSNINHGVGNGFIHLYLTSWDTSISVSDGFGNQNMYCFKNQVSSNNKLPPEAPHGYLAEIVGNGTTADDNYWLTYNSDKNNWVECPAPGVYIHYQWGTMPHALIRQADGTFEFKAIDWKQRFTGDDNTNPEPSFINGQIGDIFFFRNRLGLLSGENIVLSKSGDFFNFWFDSAAAVKDTDPIDVTASTNKVTRLSHAVPINNELILFSDGQQFVLKSDGVLTPKSVRVDTSTAFMYDTGCRPLSLGRDVYFPTKKAEFTSIFRYYAVENMTDVKNALDITTHCPTYIPNGVFHLTGHSGESLILAQTDGDRSSLWVFKYVVTDSGFIQQSWSKWNFGKHNDIIAVEFIDDELILVINKPSGLFLEKMRFTGNNKDSTWEPVRLFMDSKKFVYIPQKWNITDQNGQPIQVDAYDEYRDITRVYLRSVYDGYCPYNGRWAVVITEWGIVSDFKYREDYYNDQGLIELRGKWVGTPIAVGNVYTMEANLSQFMIKQSNDAGGVVSETEGRLQLRYGWFNHANSGPYDVFVNTLRGIFKYTSSPRIMGERKNIIGTIPITNGTFRYPLQNLSTDTRVAVFSESVLPVGIVSGGWEALYNRRSQRL